MSTIEVTTCITPKYLERKSKAESDDRYTAMDRKAESETLETQMRTTLTDRPAAGIALWEWRDWGKGVCARHGEYQKRSKNMLCPDPECRELRKRRSGQRRSEVKRARAKAAGE